MRGVVISVLVAVVLGSPLFQGTAWADEGFVCEGGRVAYVRFGELEAMKRKDPCIAAYFGAVVESDAAMTSETGADARQEQLVGRALPVIRTAGTRPAIGARTSAVPVLKEMPRLATPSASVKKVASNTPAARASAPPPVAHPETDFRNVRILNAGPGESTIFRHAR